MPVYGNYLIEGLFKSKLDKVDELIKQGKYRKAKKLLSKIKPKENEMQRYNELKNKILEYDYKNEYEDILDAATNALKWWDNPKDLWENSDYFQIISVSGVSDQKFISHLKKKVTKYTNLKNIINYMFGDERDIYIKSDIKPDDKLFIFNSNDDYIAFVNITNNKIYELVDKLESSSLKEVGGDFYDEKIIKDVLTKENIKFN